MALTRWSKLPCYYVGHLIGKTLSHFEIIGHLGEGGMGEVYRATDTHLGREVAIKVLPEAFTEDAERLARFEREAQLLASLNHQNIGAIYGLEKADDLQFLILELIEGDTLQERLARGSIPAEEAMEYGRQMAQALEVAHEAGIVHRDLKPANVKITPTGQIKVLDFGLAKAWGPAGNEVEVTQSPTLTAQMTQAGVILGTAAYMSPEQARGEPVDKRADIWSFGCLLYEMLTGRQSFSGRTVTDILASVVKEQPDLSLVSEQVPRRVLRLIERCLEKNANDRLRDIGDARIELSPTQPSSTSTIEPVVAAPRRLTLHREAASWALSVLLLVVLGWVLFSGPDSAEAPPGNPVTRFTIREPAVDIMTGDFNQSLLAMSPDGEHLIYPTAGEDGSSHLVLRSMDSLEATPIPDSKYAWAPTFSPDGESFAFIQMNRHLKIASIRGLVPTQVARVGIPRGVAWGDDGKILFAPDFESGLWRVDPEGGEPEEITRPDEAANEKSHRWPEILPGSRAALFTVITADMRTIDEAQIDAVDLATGERKTLLREATFPKYMDDGRLLFIRGSQLLSVPLDADAVEVTGRPEVVLGGVATMPLAGSAALALGRQGSMAYVRGEAVHNRLHIRRYRRDGSYEALVAPENPYQTLAVSPDGLSLAVGIDAANQGIWRLDISRGTLTRLTLSWGHNDATWSADGQWIVTTSGRKGVRSIYKVATDGTGDSIRVTHAPEGQYRATFTPDGESIIYGQEGDLYSIPTAGGEPKPIVTTPFWESDPTVSPDGRWLAYTSGESGGPEIYVQPTNGSSNRVRVSLDGGLSPIWRRDSRELYFVRAGQSTLMAVSIGDGDDPEVGNPQELFTVEGSLFGNQQYGVMPNGDFIVLAEHPQDLTSEPLIVVRHWIEELRRSDA